MGALFAARPLPGDAQEAYTAVAAIAAAAIDERPDGGSLDMRDVEATEVRKSTLLSHDFRSFSILHRCRQDRRAPGRRPP